MSKINTLIELVEAGELELAKDYAEAARTELHAIMEFDEKSFEQLGELIPKQVAEWQFQHPEFPRGCVMGAILICEVKTPSDSRLSFHTWGTMDMPHTRVGALQYVTSQVMDSELG